MQDIQKLYNWLELNLNSLKTAYNDLPAQKREEFPFVLYCVAMYYKHLTLYIDDL